MLPSTLHSLMSKMARAVLGLEPGARNEIKVCMWEVGAQLLEPSVLPSRKLRVCSQTGIESRYSDVGHRQLNHWANSLFQDNFLELILEVDKVNTN